ncbi:MAG: PP2C family protein-serine/threonine phosphatase, partial [Gammaproteobacteria bacterium]
MDVEKKVTGLRAAELEQVLEVTRKLAAPFDLTTMLSEVVDSARAVLQADRGTVFLFDKEADELEMKVGTEIESIRFPATQGIAGQCVQTREIINVPDCYQDPRFNPEFDRKSGYRTRCMLTLPLIDHDGSMVGVLQLLNKKDGVFDDEDEWIAAALAAQCAVALHRVQMTETMMLTQKLDREIGVAREIQMSGLPQKMPDVESYDGAGTFRPTDQTGGDLYDFVQLDNGDLFLLLGDATGHGIGPALSATQLRAMVRVALRLGADLDEIFTHTNNQLVDDLPDDRFVTAFMGLLDPTHHIVRFHAGGQGPLLHYKAESDECMWHGASTFPMGALPHTNLDKAVRIDMKPGDVLGLISDGIYEYEDEEGQQFGQEGVARVIRENLEAPMTDVVTTLLRSARAFGGTAPQADDITIVLV